MDPKHSPSYTNLSLVAVLFAALALLLIICRQRKGTKKSAWDLLPGPRQYFLGNYLNLLEFADNKKTVQVIASWCARFGPVTKLHIGPVVGVALSSPHHIQKVFGSMDLEHLAKPELASKATRTAPWAEGITNSEGEKWRSRRKLINPFFKLQSLQSCVPAFNEAGRRLVGRMQSIFEGDSEAVTPAPIRSALIDSTLATICKTILGIDIDSTKYDTEDFIAGTKRFLEIATTRVMQPWLGYEPLFNLTSASKELRQYYELSSKFLLQLAAEDQQLQEEGSNNKSLLRELIQAGLPNEGIYEETLTMILTGYETSGGAMQTLLYFLALHPQIQEKCQREVDQVFQKRDYEDDDDGAPSSEDDCNITLANLQNLEYLEQCLLESLRIVPTVPFAIRQLGAPLQLDDELELPSGMNVMVPIPAIHMNPQIYPEPQRFDPDRMAAERRRERHLYSYMPFSAGARKCIGSKFAKMQILIVVAHLLKHFTVRTADDKFEEVVWAFNITMQPETPIKFMFEKRITIRE